MKLKIKIFFILIIAVCLNSLGQSTLTGFKKGSLIIPMDNARQNLTSSQVAFNVKAYGLVNYLLQNNIPVNWIIKDAKAKDAIDFSVLSSRAYPSVTGASSIDYKAGPFIIDSLWASTAMPFITAFGNNVAVYKAETAFTAPVRYQLMFKPKIAVFTNGNNQDVHTKALRLAGITNAYYDSIPAQNATATSCYTFGCEPHWANGQNAVTNVITSFLNSGGNFFAQCVGISAYEQIEHYHTTNGIEYETSSGDQDNTNIYSGTDNPLMQFDGVLTNAPTGTLVNYKNNSGSYQPSTQFLVKKSPSPASGVADGDVVMSTRKIGSAANGGNATYLGGHDYLKGTFDLLDLGLLGLDYSRAGDVTWNNGLRIFYNAIFVPSTRPTACNFVFAGEAKVATSVTELTPCLNDTIEYTVYFTNAGPGTAHNVSVKTVALPAGLTYLSSTSTQGAYSTGTNSWTIGDLGPNANAQLKIKYRVVADGTYNLKCYNANLIAGNSFADDTTSLQIVTNQSAPVLVVPANVNATANSGCMATGVNLGTPTVTDQCGIASLSNNAPAAFPLGTTTVTWTVVDNSGNTVTGTQLVTVADHTNPSITAPSNVTVSTTACSVTGITLGTPTTSDNCGVASVTNDAPAAFPLGTTTVTWTVTDNSGNTSTATQTVTVTDIENPTITAPANVSVSTNSGCTAAGVDLGTPTTADNCGVASVTNDAPAAFPVGTTTVTWTVTDNSGNTATAIQTVTVTDNENPAITAPANVSASTNSGCIAAGVDLGTPTTADNCGVASLTNDAPADFPLGTTTVTWIVTDNSGNIATATQTVAVTDNENPTITAPSNVTTTTNSGCTATGVNLGTPTTADNCGVASLTNDAPADFPLGTTTVTWTATDNSGNTSTATQTVTMTDIENPTITAPANVSAFTNSGCTATGVDLGTPTTADNCGVASVTNDAPAAFPLGTTTVTWTVTDNSGNTATSSQTVTVSDNENPTITAPANVSASTNSGCTATGVDLGTPATADNCGVASLTNDAPADFPLGTTTVTWTVTDNSGNTETVTQTVAVTDNENPAITAPANITTTTNSGCTATGIDLGMPTTSDNCGVASVTNDAPAVFSLGTTTVTWTVIDNSGNTATATQTITVTDNENPAITAPANVSVSTNSGCTATGVDLGMPITADNCGVASLTNDAPAAFPLGTTTVTWTVTDNSENSATATQTVTVTDNENPAITAPLNITTTTNSGCTATAVNLGTPTTSDNCGVASVTNDAPADFPLGTTTVTWTVTDNSGNTATSSQTVTVSDNETPTITAPVNITTTTNFGCTATGVDLGTPTTSDNCGVASVTNDAPAAFPVGTTTVTWTVTDNSGNVATATQTIMVTDNETPTISNCNDTIKSCESLITFDLPQAIDNCTLASFEQTDLTGLTSGSEFPIGETILQYRAVDMAGNQQTCTKTIAHLQFPAFPNAGNDQLVYAKETTLDATPDSIGTGNWKIIDGYAIIADEHDPHSMISGLQKGTVILTWTMSNENCQSGVDTVSITAVDLNIPNGFSPDGDNKNDFFEIRGIESYGPAMLIVSNRWGEIVYESSNYQNDWNGQNKNGLNLTDDTYYYHLKLNDNSEFSGFIIMKRK